MALDYMLNEERFRFHSYEIMQNVNPFTSQHETSHVNSVGNAYLNMPSLVVISKFAGVAWHKRGMYAFWHLKN